MIPQVARDVTYAFSARTPAGRNVIRLMENATGRLDLIRRAQGYDAEVAAGANFWKVIATRYGIAPQVIGGSLSNIPATGPVVVIANHPFGVLDGLMMGHILSQRRGPDGFRILAHQVFSRAPDLARVILPVCFDATPAAREINLTTRAAATAHLKAGGAVGIFPGGTVSTAARPFGAPMDPAWRGFSARMIARSGAAVVPIWFEGANSRLFQVASHVHPTLRMGLLLREFRARINRPVRLVVGAPIAPEVLSEYARDTRKMMDFLRNATYELSPRPLRTHAYGFEFETRYRGREQQRA